MAQRYDAVVLGMGPGGEVAASRLIKGGKRIAIVEKELIGDECAYWACIPSKTLLRGHRRRVARPKEPSGPARSGEAAGPGR